MHYQCIHTQCLIVLLSLSCRMSVCLYVRKAMSLRRDGPWVLLNVVSARRAAIRCTAGVVEEYGEAQRQQVICRHLQERRHGQSEPQPHGLATVTAYMLTYAHWSSTGQYRPTDPQTHRPTEITHTYTHTETVTRTVSSSRSSSSVGTERKARREEWGLITHGSEAHGRTSTLAH